jgi:hypothetical protein
MQVGDIISGFEDEDGITLHQLIMKSDEVSGISVIQYKPTDENFAWAIEQLASLQET